MTIAGQQNLIEAHVQQIKTMTEKLNNVASEQKEMFEKSKYKVQQY